MQRTRTRRRGEFAVYSETTCMLLPDERKGARERRAAEGSMLAKGSRGCMLSDERRAACKRRAVSREGSREGSRGQHACYQTSGGQQDTWGLHAGWLLPAHVRATREVRECP